MGVAVLVGTAKGLVVLRSEDRKRWDRSPLLNKGWINTAFTRDADGRFYAGVTHDVWGAVVMASDDLESWEQLDGTPRFDPDDRGNEDHLRIVGAMDPMGRFKDGGRYVDQIWKLHTHGSRIFAGVSEAGVFRSDDRGKTWEPLRGINDHPDRGSWGPGFGGLCAHTILTDAANPDRIWVGISSAGAFRSDDGGETFVARNDGVAVSEAFCVHSMAHDPANADTIYRQDHRGFYKSIDGGDSWTLIENGLPPAELSDGHVCSFGFATGLDPRSGSVFAIPMESDGYRFPHGGKLRVYRSRDGGDHWEPQSGGLPDECYENVLRGALGLDDRDPCDVYFGTTGGAVFGSDDCGESFSELARSLPKVLTVAAYGV